MESVTLGSDGTTLFVVGDTSSSGGFVNGTADQVHDQTRNTSVTVGVNPQGAKLTAEGPGAGIENAPLAGRAASVTGCVLVMSSDGQSHLWSSYLSPSDPRKPQFAGTFRASSATFVTDVNVATYGLTLPDGKPDTR